MFTTPKPASALCLSGRSSQRSPNLHQTFILSVFLFVAVCASPWRASFAYSGGNGTSQNPYQIADVNNLLQLAADTNNYDKCFILTADIDLASYTFTSAVIAPDTNNFIDGFQGTRFTGVFDGAGHKIANLTIGYEGETYYLCYCGLFGYIEGGEVKNLGLENFSITSANRLTFSGALVGSCYGNINNCFSTGILSSKNNSVALGGLVGWKRGGSINDCYSTGTLSVGGDHSDNLGGLAGLNDGNITNSHSAFIITSGNHSSCLGGLVGSNNGTISRCFATGNVSGYNNVNELEITNLGGLVGCNDHGTITDSYATGDVTAGEFLIGYLGGLAGSNLGGTIVNCFATGTVTGIGSLHGPCTQLGGLAGQNGYSDHYGTIINCFATGNVSSNYYSNCNGGLVGANGQWSSISNSYSTGTITGESYLGGLVGNNGGYITECFSGSPVIGRENSTNIGGLVGSVNGILSYEYVAISNCYSTGTVTGGNGSNYIGGFVGSLDEGIIDKCYSSGYINGGIGSDNIGGFAGNRGNYTDINSCYFLNISGPNNNIATSLTDAQMKQRASFVGWDFVDETANGTDNIWRMCVDGVNYPRLWWQFISGDFTCTDIVDFIDFARLANWWKHADCADNNDCDRTDMNLSGAVDIYDLKLFCENWLKDSP